MHSGVARLTCEILVEYRNALIFCVLLLCAVICGGVHAADAWVPQATLTLARPLIIWP